ncbi:MAG: glucosaminidase domain-containing protein [Pseudobdellovibrionaceae bacterium]
MRQQIVFLKIVDSIAKFIVLASLLPACGGKLEGGYEVSNIRPPATSDPLSAIDQRRWDSATPQLQFKSQSQGFASPLETQVERETFFRDVTEQAPTRTNKELASAAEDQFQKKVNSSTAQKKTSDLAAAAQTRVEHARTAKSAVANTELKPKSKLNPNSSSNTKARLELNADLKSGDGGSQEMPGVISPSHAEICDGLDVISGNMEVNLSSLYNVATPLPISMPSDQLARLRSQDKKNKFICILLPVAIRMSEEVFKQRMEVLRLQAKQQKGLSLTKEDELWLTDIKNAYELEPQSSFEEVLKRVDIIPLPLLLAQAALESGWGTSRATRELKNLFGMHAQKGQECRNGFDHTCVRVFPSLAASVSAYIRLLNVGDYYSEFRNQRARMRSNNEALDSIKLLQALGNYNVTPVKYIEDVRALMTKSNKLTQFVFQEEA